MNRGDATEGRVFKVPKEPDTVTVRGCVMMSSGKSYDICVEGRPGEPVVVPTLEQALRAEISKLKQEIADLAQALEDVADDHYVAEYSSELRKVKARAKQALNARRSRE